MGKIFSPNGVYTTTIEVKKEDTHPDALCPSTCNHCAAENEEKENEASKLQTSQSQEETQPKNEKTGAKQKMAAALKMKLQRPSPSQVWQLLESRDPRKAARQREAERRAAAIGAKNIEPEGCSPGMEKNDSGLGSEGDDEEVVNILADGAQNLEKQQKVMHCFMRRTLTSPTESCFSGVSTLTPPPEDLEQSLMMADEEMEDVGKVNTLKRKERTFGSLGAAYCLPPLKQQKQSQSEILNEFWHQEEQREQQRQEQQQQQQQQKQQQQQQQQQKQEASSSVADPPEYNMWTTAAPAIPMPAPLLIAENTATLPSLPAQITEQSDALMLNDPGQPDAKKEVCEHFDKVVRPPPRGPWKQTFHEQQSSHPQLNSPSSREPAAVAAQHPAAAVAAQHPAAAITAQHPAAAGAAQKPATAAAGQNPAQSVYPNSSWLFPNQPAAQTTSDLPADMLKDIEPVILTKEDLQRNALLRLLRLQEMGVTEKKDDEGNLECAKQLMGMKGQKIIFTNCNHGLEAMHSENAANQVVSLTLAPVQFRKMRGHFFWSLAKREATFQNVPKIIGTLEGGNEKKAKTFKKLAEAGLVFQREFECQLFKQTNVVSCHFCGNLRKLADVMNGDPWANHCRDCPFALMFAPVKHQPATLTSLDLSEQANVDLSYFSVRLATFENWPHSPKLFDPVQIARAGCFYTGVSDKLSCVAGCCAFSPGKKGENFARRLKRNCGVKKAIMT